MRLIFATIALIMSSGATAQTLPGPEDYDAAVATALTDRFAYCWTGPATGAGTFAAGLGLWITEDFPDAEAVDRETRQAEGIAAIRRLIADGRVIHEEATLRLVECPATDWQIEARLLHRTSAFRRFSDEDGVELLTSAVTAYGCTIQRHDEAEFIPFAIRHVAGLYDIPLPDPLPEGEDELLTPFVEQLLYVLESAGSDMRRDGQMITEGGTARLAGCTPTGAAPVPESQDGTPPVPATAAARAEALDDEDLQGILREAFAAVGCNVPMSHYWLFARFFSHSALSGIGVELPPQEFVTADRDLALTQQTDHPYGAAISTLNYYGAFFPTLIDAIDDDMLEEDSGDLLGLNCTPIGDLTVLDTYLLPSE